MLMGEISRPGIVTGLVAYSSGGNGSILFIEVADMPGSGSVQLTGKLGDVLKESVEVALSWVKAHAYELGLTHDPAENIMKKRSIHVHCPSGAIPKVKTSSSVITYHSHQLGWAFCRNGAHHSTYFLVLGQGCPPNYGYDGKCFQVLWLLLFLMQSRVKSPFVAVSPRLGASKRS